MKGSSKTSKRSNKSKVANDERESASFKVPLPKARRDSTASKQSKPTPNAKRRSSVSGSMHKRPTTPDGDDDDDDDDLVSVAESHKSKSGRVQRSEAERIQYLKNDPACGDFEPFRAFCKKCNKRLSLGRRTTYSLQIWLRHRERCDKKTEVAEDESAEEKGDTADHLPPLPSTSQSEDSELTDIQLRAIIEMDPRAEVVESQRIRCRKCRRWVKLGTKPRYGGILQWLIHQMRCHRSLHGSDAADAARVALMQVLRLGKDSQALTFTFGTVECTVCGQHVSLEPDRDYDLTTWEEHKLECPKDSVRPPSSSASASSVSADADTPVRIGKRRREDEDDEEAEPSRNRPRKETDPGTLGWLLHPFRMFVRGFRDGLSS